MFGSSPLARGTLSTVGRGSSARRLIPARAGNTDEAFNEFYKDTAHPRSRGEHLFCAENRAFTRGSSPLARGTLLRGGNMRYPSRLIPARAGNTAAFRIRVSARTAHPRSRGEHSNIPANVGGIVGSSPLARGTHLLTWGFTPYISKIESLSSQSLTPEYTITNCS